MEFEKVLAVIPVLSLIVAALAVFVGPIVGWIAGRQQMLASLAVANKQILAPMRQAWINELRDNLAELASDTLHYFVSGMADRKDSDYQKLTLLEHKISLMVNPEESDHHRLLEVIRNLVSALESGKERDSEFIDAHKELVPLSRGILKREWDRVKGPIVVSKNVEEPNGVRDKWS